MSLTIHPRYGMKGPEAGPLRIRGASEPWLPLSRAFQHRLSDDSCGVRAMGVELASYSEWSSSAKRWVINVC